jgi:hypothetical protein
MTGASELGIFSDVQGFINRKLGLPLESARLGGKELIGRSIVFRTPASWARRMPQRCGPGTHGRLLCLVALRPFSLFFGFVVLV